MTKTNFCLTTGGRCGAADEEAGCAAERTFASNVI